MIERSTIFRRGISITALSVLASLGVASCDSNPGPALAKFRSGDSVASFISNQFAAQKIETCTGSANLRTDGNVRFSPTSLPTDNQVPDLSDDSFNTINRVTITNPLKTELYNDNSGSSRIWYIAKLLNGQTVFIDHDAFVQDTFACKQLASDESPYGSITATPTPSKK